MPQSRYAEDLLTSFEIGMMSESKGKLSARSFLLLRMNHATKAAIVFTSS